MSFAQQRLSQNLASYFAEVLVAGLRDHAQRFKCVLREADLYGFKVEAHNSSWWCCVFTNPLAPDGDLASNFPKQFWKKVSARNLAGRHLFNVHCALGCDLSAAVEPLPNEPLRDTELLGERFLREAVLGEVSLEVPHYHE